MRKIWLCGCLAAMAPFCAQVRAETPEEVKTESGLKFDLSAMKDGGGGGKDGSAVAASKREGGRLNAAMRLQKKKEDESKKCADIPAPKSAEQKAREECIGSWGFGGSLVGAVVGAAGFYFGPLGVGTTMGGSFVGVYVGHQLGEKFCR